VWTLQTAAVQWQRGLRADAIVWVRKAADTATQLGAVGRAEELRNHAARLAEYLWSDPEEPFDDAPPSPVPLRALGTRQRVARPEPDEIIEVEELEGDELDEFTETDLATPDDAVADISAEDLTYYEDDPEAAEPTHVLPDDLDLDSDSERPGPDGERDSYMSVSPEPDTRDSYMSVSPEPNARDSYMSVSPDLDEETVVRGNRDSYLDVSPEPAESAPPFESAPISDRPTQPRIIRQPLVARHPREEPLAAARFPTQPSPAASAPPDPEPAPFVATSPSWATAPAEPVSSDEDQPPAVDGLAFESVEALADLPEEAQSELAECAQRVTLNMGEAYVLEEGAALITRGTAHVTLTFSDVSAARVGVGAVIAARGSIESGPLRLIADAAQTHVVTWTEAQLAGAMRDCPWVVDDLRVLADRFQAHASAGLGPLGERLDDALRAAVYERLQVRVLSPDESVAERGKPLKGLFVMAVGELNVASGAAQHRIGAGEFLFPGCVIGAEPAPHDAKAGPKGGLVLFATRPVAHELMMSVPPLLEILAS
jgi:hypothetical protein